MPALAGFLAMVDSRKSFIYLVAVMNLKLQDAHFCVTYCLN